MDLVEATTASVRSLLECTLCFYFLLGRDKIPFPVKDFPFFQTHSGCDGYARFSWQALHALSKKQLYWFHLHLVKILFVIDSTP